MINSTSTKRFNKKSIIMKDTNKTKRSNNFNKTLIKITTKLQTKISIRNQYTIIYHRFNMSLYCRKKPKSRSPGDLTRNPPNSFAGRGLRSIMKALQWRWNQKDKNKQCQTRKKFKIKWSNQIIKKMNIIRMNKDSMLIKCGTKSHKHIMCNITPNKTTNSKKCHRNKHKDRWIQNKKRKFIIREMRFRQECKDHQSNTISSSLNSSNQSKDISHSTSSITRNKCQFKQNIFRIKSSKKWKSHQRQTSQQNIRTSNRHRDNKRSHFTNILYIRNSMNNSTSRQKLQCFKRCMILQMKQSLIILRQTYSYHHITLLTSCRKCYNFFLIIFHQTISCSLQSRQSTKPSYYYQTCRRIFLLRTTSYLKIYTCCYHCSTMLQCRYWCRTFHSSQQPTMQTKLSRFSDSTDDHGDCLNKYLITIQIFYQYPQSTKTDITQQSNTKQQSQKETHITNTIHKKSFNSCLISCYTSKIKSYKLITYQTYTFPTYKQYLQIITCYLQLHKKTKQTQIRIKSIYMIFSIHIILRIHLYTKRYPQYWQLHRSTQCIKIQTPFLILISRINPRSLSQYYWRFIYTYFYKYYCSLYCCYPYHYYRLFWTIFYTCITRQTLQSIYYWLHYYCLIHSSYSYCLHGGHRPPGGQFQ